jgi:triosephosphate isomerase
VAEKSTRTPLIAGNWKMNLTHVEGIDLTQKLIWNLSDARFNFEAVEVLVIPSFTSIRSIQTVIESEKTGVKYGAQDVSSHDDGAYTGEVSANMLKALGVSYVVVGHSERREYHKESDALVAQKAIKAQAHDMAPIICVGEPLEIRKEGTHVEYVLRQVEGSIAGVKDLKHIVIAYEPVWAIGTGEVATPEDAEEVCGAIRRRLAELHGPEIADAIRILYGGSVKSSNVSEIMEKENVDGALVGGASLKADEFAKIARFS